MTVLESFFGRVEQEANKVELSRLFLLAIIAIPLVLGWLAGKVVVCFRFIFAAIKVGYREAVKKGGSG